MNILLPLKEVGARVKSWFPWNRPARSARRVDRLLIEIECSGCPQRSGRAVSQLKQLVARDRWAREAYQTHLLIDEGLRLLARQGELGKAPSGDACRRGG